MWAVGPETEDVFMEPAVEEVPAEGVEPLSAEATPPEGAAPQAGSDEDIAGQLRLQILGRDGNWGTQEEGQEGAQGPRSRLIALDIIAFLLDGKVCRNLYDVVRRKRIAEEKAEDEYLGVEMQLHQVLTLLCNQRVVHREWLNLQRLGHERSAHGEALWLEVDELNDKYQFVQKRREIKAMSIADHRSREWISSA